jgi:hypothetical protein
MDEFKNPQSELANGLSKRMKPGVIEDVGNTVKEVIYGREDYPYDQQRLINRYGSNMVKRIRIGRTPLPSTLTKILNVVTLGGFNKMISKSPYDDLFHLFSIITLDNGVDILSEKNQSINMHVVHGYNPKGAEYIDINNIPDISFVELLNNARKRMGRDFFNYHPTNNNCQDFIIALLGTMLSSEAKDFIKQNVVSIFTNYPKTRKLMATLTKLGTAVDVVQKGLKLKFL